MALAAIGLGSNLGEPAASVERALAALATLGDVVARSGLYRTAAWGETAQPDFINAAALLETALAPRELLAALKGLERDLGRVASYRWGPRAIDLDILTYGDLRVDESGLVIPHARLFERAFALAPLAEIAPAFNTAYEALPAEDRASVQRIRFEPERTDGSVSWDETLERVRSAAEFCASSGLTRFRIDEDDLEIDVRRSVRAALPAPAPGEPLEEVPAAHGATNGSAAPRNGHRTFKADFVGIVRFSRPTVDAGSVVTGDRELAYVESLGIRNPVRSGGPCRVSEVFVSDGQPVGYGQPLLTIEPSDV